MIDSFFQGLQVGDPLYWGGFLVSIFFIFKLIKNMGKVMVAIIVIALILYTFIFYNPEFLESILNSLARENRLDL